MKVATRNSTKQIVATKRFEVILNEDAVNAYKNALRQKEQQERQQQQQQHQVQRSHRQHEIRTKQTTITIVGAKNRKTIHSAMNIGNTTITQVNRTQANKSSAARKSNGKTMTQNAACQVNINDGPRNSNGSMVFQRNINNCFKAMMTLNEQHAHAAAELKTEYNGKLEQLKRDYTRRLEEIKKQCFSDAGFWKKKRLDATTHLKVWS